MNASKHSRIYLILGLVFALLFSHLPVVYTLLYHQLTGAPTAAAGNIDVKDVSPNQTIYLDGQWEFYWNRLIITDGHKDQLPDFYINVPDYWSKYKIDENWLPAGGFGSYRLSIKGLDYQKPVSVFIPNFGSAYRVFIDGVLTAESGIVSKNPKEVHTVPRPYLYPVTLDASKDHEVVIEVATTRFSGLYIAPVLKDYRQAVEEDETRTALRFMLFGTVMVSFIVLIVVYIFSQQKNFRAAWLPGLSLMMILRIMLTTEFYSFWQSNIFFKLSYEATNELMFFVTFVLKILLIFLAQEQFGVFFTRREKHFFFIYYTVIYLIYFFTPNAIYNRYLTIVIPVLAFALEFYAFFKVYFRRHHMKKYGILVFWGIILALSGLIIECYYINGNIYPNVSLALLIMLSICLLIISLVSALNIAVVYKDLAVSSSRLELAKTQITIQKEYYDALSGRINEIRAIKHDMRHFVGVIKALLNEGRFEELRHFLDEYTERTETEPLPVFCDNPIANSIIGYYSLKAKKSNIPFYCACSIPKKLSMSDSDLCVVLGNALENAIEACDGLDNLKERFISVEARAANGQLLIKIDNSHDGRLNVQNGEYISTKNEKTRGIGMQNIRKVVEAYGGYMDIEHDEKVFTLMAAFPSSCGFFEASDAVDVTSEIDAIDVSGT